MLLKRKEDSRFKVECPVSYEDVSVLALLDGMRLDKPVGALPRTTRIFLASSAELRQDRDAFDLYCRQQNDRFRRTGRYLEVVRWENFLDAISETRLQGMSTTGRCAIATSSSVCFLRRRVGLRRKSFRLPTGSFKTAGSRGFLLTLRMRRSGLVAHGRRI